VGGRGENRDDTEKELPAEQDRGVRDGLVCPECGRHHRPAGPAYCHRCPYCGYDYGIEYEVH
jgi:tRNA(Ile2) C34 agmatinyltransferase TiaS